MKYPWPLLVAAVLIVPACGDGGSKDLEFIGGRQVITADAGAGTIAALRAEAATPIGDAIATALAKQPGTVLEAELEDEIENGKRSLTYEIMIRAADGRVFTARISPDTGDVAGVEVEDDAEEIEEMSAIAAALPAGSKPLADLIAAAEKHTGGRALAAEFEAEDDGVECEVLILKDGKLLEVEVDPATGEILEVEADDDDDDEDDDDDDDDDHGHDHDHDHSHGE